MNFKIYVVSCLFCVIVSLESSASGTREMVKIPAGTFIMGDDMRGDDGDSPRHVVQLDSFYMDKYEVTQGEYKQLMGINPIATKENVEITERFKKGESLNWFSKLVGDKYPVTDVSWYDTARYCNARSKAVGLEPCYDEETWECDFSKNGYRLPTEAEWEYACRADTIGTYFFERDENRIDYVNFFPHLKEYYDVYYRKGCFDREGVVWDKPFPRILPVGSKKPNNWGLYDMLGNVNEWCNDWRSKTYYDQSPVRNPRGAENGEWKVERGGRYADDIWECARRGGCPPASPYSGFRCVKNNDDDERDIDRISPALEKLLVRIKLEDINGIFKKISENYTSAKTSDSPPTERMKLAKMSRDLLDELSIKIIFEKFKNKNVIINAEDEAKIKKMRAEVSDLISILYYEIDKIGE